MFSKYKAHLCYPIFSSFFLQMWCLSRLHVRFKRFSCGTSIQDSASVVPPAYSQPSFMMIMTNAPLSLNGEVPHALTSIWILVLQLKEVLWVGGNFSWLVNAGLWKSFWGPTFNLLELCSGWDKEGPHGGWYLEALQFTILASTASMKIKTTPVALPMWVHKSNRTDWEIHLQG